MQCCALLAQGALEPPGRRGAGEGAAGIWRRLPGGSWARLLPPARVGRGMNTPPHWLDLTTSLFSASPRAPVG